MTFKKVVWETIKESRKAQFTILMLVLAPFMIYGMWQVKRTVNYGWGYESRVVESVRKENCRMLKPEVFKNYEKECK